MFAYRGDDGLRQHSNPILPTFGATHDDLTALNDEILDAKPVRLHQPQSAAVEKTHNQPRSPVELRQHRSNLGRAQHHRQPLWPESSRHVLNQWQFDAENMPVKKQQCLIAPDSAWTRSPSHRPQDESGTTPRPTPPCPANVWGDEI